MTRLLAILLLAAITSGCGGSSDASFDNGNARLLAGITVSPASAETPAGTFQQFTATGRYTDGSEEDITTRAAWSSENSSVASIDGSGLASAVSQGTTGIVASLDGLEGRGELVVTAATVTALEIFPPVAKFPLGTTQDYRAFVYFSDGSLENVTFDGEWSLSREPPIIEPYTPVTTASSRAVDDFGTAIGINVGVDQLTFAYLGLTATADVEISDAVLVDLSISPRDKSVPIGTLTPYAAKGTFSDGSARDITQAVSWSSSNTSVATISNSSPLRGQAEALALGETTISASIGGFSDATRLRVNGDPIVRLDVSPVRQAIQVGGFQQFIATAIHASGETENVTSAASWSTDNDAVSTISDSGLATGLQAGSAGITATFLGISGSATLSVEAITLLDIIVEPAFSKLLPLHTAQLTATAYYSDQSHRDITDEVTWTSLDTDIVAVSNDPGIGRGIALGLLSGEATVKAAMPGEAEDTAGTASITVLPLVEAVDKLEVNPPRAKSLVGETQQYEAILVLDNGIKIDVTNYVTWTSGDTAVATVDAAGLAHGEGAGKTAISAAIPDGTISGQGTLSVFDPVTVVDVVVSPPASEVLVGATQPYTAIALLSDGQQVDVTSDADWSTGDGNIAQIAPGGLATGVNPGSTGVFATLDAGGSLTQGAATVSVLPVITVEELVVSPPDATILAGDQQPYRAVVRLSDGRSLDITDTATWRSSDDAVAQVAPGGLATGKSAGATIITAGFTFEGQRFEGNARLSVTAITVDHIQIAPKATKALVGDGVRFTASAIMTDGSVQDITRLATWYVQDDTIATIESGKKAGLATGLSPGLTGVYVEYSEDGSAVPCLGDPRCEASLQILAPSVTELQVTPARADIPVGGALQYTATALLDNGDSVDVTGSVSWRSADKAIASIDPTGMARGVTAGSVGISAILVDDGTSFTGSANLTVNPPPVTIEDLRVTPENASIVAGDSLRYTATALLSDGSAVDVTDQAAWSSADGNIAHIDSAGLATGLSAGGTTITASVSINGDPASGTTALTVQQPLTLEQVVVQPGSAKAVAGETRQFRAIASFSDGSSQDVTSRSIWFTGDALVAGIASGANAGLATALTAGSTSVWANFSFDGVAFTCAGNASCEALLSVSDPVVAQRIDVKPQQVSILVGSTAQFIAELVFSDGSVVDITDTASWSSSDPDTAALQQPTGLFIGVAAGSATVTASASVGGATLGGSASLVVEPPAVTVDRLEVVPASASVFVGDSGSFQALAYLSNGLVQDVTSSSVWRSSDTSVGIIDPNTAFGQALSAGATTVSASYRYEGNLSVGESQVQVIEAQPQLLEVSPATAYIPAGDTRQYTATLHYEDGREEPVTGSVAWQSVDPAIATVSNAPGNRGEVKALAQGLTGIRAVHGSGLEAAAALEVIAPVLVSLEIQPVAAQLIEGESTRLFALATFSDESVLIISDVADWSSDSNGVASVANDAQNGGVVLANQAGSATITAAYQGTSATASVTVQANSLVTGYIEPSSNTLQVGDEQDYRAFGEFLDGSTREITSEVVWQTTNPAIATVGNTNNPGTGQLPGRVHAIAEGSAEIYATFEGTEVGRSTLTVVGLTTVGLEIIPGSATLRPGGTTAFTATATYDNATSEDVTHLAIWGTQNSNVAVISNQPGSHGLATATGQGITDVTARYDGLQDSATLSVSSGSCQGRPTSIVIDAGDQTVTEGQTVRFTARAIYSNGCNQDITNSNQTVWRSLNNNVCRFLSPKGGEALGVSVGTATVEAKHRGITDTALCTVLAR